MSRNMQRALNYPRMNVDVVVGVFPARTLLTPTGLWVSPFHGRQPLMLLISVTL